MHLQRKVLHIAIDTRLGFQFQDALGMNRAGNLAIDDDVLGRDRAVDDGGFGNHQQAVVCIIGPNVAMHFAVNAQTIAECNVAGNAAAFCNQAFDGGLLFFG